MSVEDFIDTIEDLQADCKQQLKIWVASGEFGADLAAPCGELFKEALLAKPPTGYNHMQLTALKRAVKKRGPTSPPPATLCCYTQQVCVQEVPSFCLWD